MAESEEYRSDPGNSIISLRVQLNYELEREILGFVDGIKVPAPRSLQKIVERKARKMLQLYEEKDDEN